MQQKRAVLTALSRMELQNLADSFDVEVADRRVRSEFVDALGRSHRATLDRMLEALSRESLKAICRALGYDDRGREKQVLVDRLTGESNNAGKPAKVTTTRQRTKRSVLEALTRPELQNLATTFDVSTQDRRVRDDLIDGLTWARRVSLADILSTLPRKLLKRICLHLGLDESGKEKAKLIGRILGDGEVETGGVTQTGPSTAGVGDSTPKAATPKRRHRARRPEIDLGSTVTATTAAQRLRESHSLRRNSITPAPVSTPIRTATPTATPTPEPREVFMPTAVPTETSVRAFYAACLRGLRVVEQRQPTNRRYGPEADALWKTFCGNLSTAARIDLLLRDMAASYSTAFAATQVFFHMPPASEDEPFGAYWPAIDAVEAEEIWRSTPTMNGSTPLETLRACTEPWELKLQKIDTGHIDAQTRLIAVGPSAVASLANAFSGSRDLDWAEQVWCVATRPAHRHLAGLAAAVINASKSTTLLGRTMEAPPISTRRIDRIVTGPDADPADVAWANEHFKIA